MRWVFQLAAALMAFGALLMAAAAACAGWALEKYYTADWWHPMLVALTVLAVGAMFMAIGGALIAYGLSERA